MQLAFVSGGQAERNLLIKSQNGRLRYFVVDYDLICDAKVCKDGPTESLGSGYELPVRETSFESL